jgi:starch-binding outer membrane protein, SusD/RagB family
MKSKIILFLFAGALGFLSSCDDYLDEAPKSYLTPEQYLTDESHLAAYSIARYGVFPTHGNWSFGTFGIDAGTDNMASDGYDNKYVPGQYKVGQNGGDWSFSDIYQCNYFLNKVVPRLKANTITGNIDNIKHYIGEMYMIRAYVYFTKLQALGDFPIVKTVLPDNQEILAAASKRAPRNEVARFILKDLDSAITLMKTVAPDGMKNRLSKYCALLLKSRVALYEGTWLKYFKGTAFVPNGPNWPGKAKDYNANYQYSSGSIDKEIEFFLDEAIASSKEVADAFSLVNNNKVLQQSASDAVNPYFSMFSDVDLSGYSEVLLWRKYDNGLSILHNVPVYAQSGNRAVGLTRGMVEGFLMANGLPIYAAGSGYAGDDQISDVRKNRDGRLWLFLKEPGQKNVLYPSSLGTHATPVELTPAILISDAERKYTTGYAIRKGLNYDAAQCGNGHGYTGSIVFRATEAYLNYIEAYYERFGSLDAKADDYWKRIRNRAGVDPDFNNTIAATDLSKEAANDWGVYSAGQMVDKTLYNIRRERRCELMAEGLRFMDLKRWRALDQMIATPYHVEGFKLWGGTIQTWYSASDLKYDIGDASNVSSPTRSQYIRPYEKTPTNLAYNGYKWAMAHYLSPIASQHFLITSKDGKDASTSPIYQNPGWSTTPNTAPIQ